MPHLYTVRSGWENERLAEYLLSRFSFVAQPTTIADDAGSDFYCTIFDISNSEPPTVEPRISFAIQVKSNRDRIEFHNKVQYLHNLEIPFFLGVVNQARAEIEVYSAEHFPMMTAVYGLRKKLWLRPVDADDPGHRWDGDTDPEGVTLNCYRVCTFSTSEERWDIRPKVEMLVAVCQRATANVRSRRSEEHIYQWDDKATTFSIVAGLGSIEHFRDNLYKRLAEAFYNFEFLINNQPQNFSLAEFRVYERFYLAIKESYERPMLGLAQGMYERIRHILDQRNIVLQDRAQRFETFVTWYLRFNGYFTIPSFVVHAGDDPTRISGDTIGNLTEIDTIAVRLPYSREESGTPFPLDTTLVDEDARGRIDVVLAEVKSGDSNSPNRIWRKDETSHIEYLLKLLGWHEDDAEIKKAAKELAQNYTLEEPKPNLRVRYIIFGKAPDLNWGTKGVKYITFNDCIKFIAEERGQCWANSGIGRRSMHDQWNPLIKRIYKIANNPSSDPASRQKQIEDVLWNGHAGE